MGFCSGGEQFDVLCTCRMHDDVYTSGFEPCGKDYQKQRRSRKYCCINVCQEKVARVASGDVHASLTINRVTLATTLWKGAVMQILKRRRTARGLFGPAVFLGLTLLLLGPSLQADTEHKTSFDHAITGFPLSGAHQRTPCESCHVNGIFKGTPNQCIFCHQSGSKTSSTSKPPNHIPTNASCDECHASTSTWAGAHFNHFSMGGVACMSCHNGSSTTGKPSNHVPSAPACESCHRSTATWSGAKYDHAGIASSCTSCHNGVYLGVAGAPPATHTSPDQKTNCQYCHTPSRPFP